MFKTKIAAALLSVSLVAGCTSMDADTALLATCQAFDRTVAAMTPHVGSMSVGTVKRINDYLVPFMEGACLGEGPWMEVIGDWSTENILTAAESYLEELLAIQAGIGQEA